MTNTPLSDDAVPETLEQLLYLTVGRGAGCLQRSDHPGLHDAINDALAWIEARYEPAWPTLANTTTQHFGDT